MRYFGKDFQCIAQLIGTKTTTQVRAFFSAYKKKYNLDAALAEYEASQKSKAQKTPERVNNYVYSTVKTALVNVLKSSLFIVYLCLGLAGVSWLRRESVKLTYCQHGAWSFFAVLISLLKFQNGPHFDFY